MAQEVILSTSKPQREVGLSKTTWSVLILQRKRKSHNNKGNWVPTANVAILFPHSSRKKSSFQSHRRTETHGVFGLGSTTGTQWNPHWLPPRIPAQYVASHYSSLLTLNVVVPVLEFVLVKKERKDGTGVQWTCSW